MTEHVSHYHSNIAFVMRTRAEQIIVKYVVKFGKTSSLYCCLRSHR